MVSSSVLVLCWWHLWGDVCMIPHCVSLPLMTLVIHRYLLKTQATLLQNGDYVVKRGLQIERGFFRGTLACFVWIQTIPLTTVFNTRCWPLPWFFHTICGRTVYVLKRIRTLHLQILHQYITILHIFPSRSFLLHLKPWMSSVWRLSQAFWSSQRIWFSCISSISASLLKCINRLLIVTLVNHIGKCYCTNKRGRTK